MERVALDACQVAYLVEHRIDHLGVETTAAVRRWWPVKETTLAISIS